MYYKFIPVWKNNYLSDKEKRERGMFGGIFIGDDSIVNTKFKTLEDGIEAARLDGTALREQNWEIFECGFFCKKRIMLKSLQNMGLLSSIIDKDDISEIYNFKLK